MIAKGESAVDNTRTWSAAWCALALVVTIATISLVVFPTAYILTGPEGLRLAAIAATLCLVTGFGSLAITCACHRRHNPLLGFLGSMAFRMLPPLVVCLALAVGGLQSTYEPFVFSLLVYYLGVLGMETWLSVRLVQTTDSTTEG